YAEALPHAELLELADAGHWPWLDRPDLVERLGGFPSGEGARSPTRGGRPPPRAGAGPRRLPPAWTITAVLAVAYLIIAPSSPDLAAASYRSELFARSGFSL